MQTEEVRAKTFNIRFSDEEWARLDALAEHHGLNAAGLIRHLLKKEERLIGLASSGSDARWAHVKEEAQQLVALAEIPRMRVSFDEDTRTIVLTDGEVTKIDAGGNGAWFNLANWPGSKLRKNQGLPEPEAVASAIGPLPTLDEALENENRKRRGGKPLVAKKKSTK